MITIKENLDIYNIKVIVDLLKRNEIECYLYFINKNYHITEWEPYIVTSYMEIDYDCIISYNYLKLKKSQYNCPKIWIGSINNHECSIKDLIKIPPVFDAHFSIDSSHTDLINNNVKKIFRRLFLISETSPVRSETRKQGIVNVLIDLNNINYLLSILPSLNELTNIYFTILADSKYKELINQNIQIKPKNKIGRLSDYDIVIANQMTAVSAIMEGIKCIVIGDKGYGGIITENNIEDQYNIYFNGRMGGYINEIIPQEKLKEDILSIINNDSSFQEKITNKLINIKNSNLKKFIKLICDLIDNYNWLNNSFEEVSLIQSKCYKFVKMDDTWAIFDIYSRYHFSIGREEYGIIKKFKKRSKVKDVINKTLIDKEEILCFIMELFKYKILTFNY